MKVLVYLFLSVLAAGGLWSVKDRFASHGGTATLNLPLLHEIDSFDPAIAFNDDSLTVIGQSLETLYQYHYLKRPYELIPSLADGMPKVSEAGKVYEIKIKRGVYYQDQGRFFDQKRELKAQDFINQIKRLAFRPLGSTGSWLFSGKLKGFDEFSERVGDSFERMMSEEIPGVQALDDYTLRFELERPESNMLYFLAMTFTAPVPEEVLRETGNDLSKTLVGTGPFYLSEDRDKAMVFLKNPYYRQEQYPAAGDRYANTQSLLNSSTERLPFLDKVVFKIFEDESERWEAFLDGELDILSVPKKFLVKITQSASPVGDELRKKGIKIKQFSSVSSRWLAFNMRDPVVGANLNLRKAVAHAIDYEAYIERLSNNTNLRANSIFNPSIPGYDPSHQMDYDTSLEKAREYLRLAGYAPGELTLTYTTRGMQDIHRLEANFIREQLEKIGIKVEIREVEFSEFLKRGRAGELQFFTDNWYYDYPSGENLLQLLITSNAPGINKSGYSNQRVDELYRSLAGAADYDRRIKLMREIEEQVNQDIPWIMLMFESAYILHSPKVQNFRKSYFIRNHLKYLKKQ